MVVHAPGERACVGAYTGCKHIVRLWGEQVDYTLSDLDSSFARASAEVMAHALPYLERYRTLEALIEGTESGAVSLTDAFGSDPGWQLYKRGLCRVGCGDRPRPGRPYDLRHPFDAPGLLCRMPRSFNTGGPCKADIDYMLPPERRLVGARELIDAGRYFVLHAQRQIGKSTAALCLGDTLTAEGKYASVMLSVETGVPFEDLGRAVPAILGAWHDRAEDRLPPELHPPPWPAADPGDAIGAALRAWARACPRPLVLFLDEVDSLAPEVLGSLLGQLRNRYNDRPQAFPWSIGLVGMRDVKDYVVAAGGTGRSGAGSPFNILAGSLTMRLFTRDEVGELYAQHTSDTGQSFEPAAVDRAFELTRGQPWLVNALAGEATSVLVRDRSAPVRAADIDEAKETLVRTRPNHLQSLGSRLRDGRVRPVVEAVMTGGEMPALPDDDLEYVRELGLVRYDDRGNLELANPIYADAMPRALASALQMGMPAPGLAWLDDTGRLDLTRLLTGLLQFWVQYGHRMLKAAPYLEIAAQLVLLTYLHRVANGGGSVTPEFSLHSERIDLCLRRGDVSLGIELKVWRDKQKDPLEAGMTQLDGYLAKLNAGGPRVPGWLVIFDQRKRAGPVEERTRTREVKSASGFDVVVIRA